MAKKKDDETPTDHLTQQLAAGEEAVAKEIALICDGVRYGPFGDLDPPLPVSEFMDLRAVAIMKRLFGYDEFRIAERLGRQRSTVDRLLGHPHFSKVDDLLRENIREVGGASSLDDLVKKVGVRAGKEAALIAMGGPSRERASAVNAFMDRVVPKRPRDDKPGGRSLVLPENLLATINRAIEMHGAGQKALDSGDVVDAEVVEIDAGVLNVPKA